MDADTGSRPVEDLTGRARIRDAALAEFAEHGFTGTTMKRVAAGAGVSIGLVQHHFGTKEALRQACDEAVIEAFRRDLTTAAVEGELGDPDFLSALQGSSPPLLRYLARVAVDDGPAAAYVFDQLAAGAEEFLAHTFPDRFEAGSAQVKAVAAVMAAMHSGTIVLHRHLARRLGVDPLGRADSSVPLAILDLYAAMGEFVGSEVGQQIRTSVVAQRRLEEQKRHGRRSGDGRAD
ncbi:TetR/AcrR family transcriptional regulator [Microlunatus parietis]|uniref:AcrR family transcriptional regulator n=1 Tax=Microlunatus parietis TaxID=682979 RepID=A0A7Y9LAS5_9ACTN|nr:helix-turn-helix domain-containing protein [Microlunatus parietis]NYE69900.1 AcrR family transcriptional regulator [Microlunatus parietis]